MDEDSNDGRILALIALVLVALIGYGVAAAVLSASSGSDVGDDAPRADWNLTRINDTHVDLVHAGGESVPVEQLFLSVNGTTRYPNWNDRHVVLPQDAGTFQAERGSSIVLIWQRTASDQVVLERWDDV
jgi:hypothetical protein